MLSEKRVELKKRRDKEAAGIMYKMSGNKDATMDFNKSGFAKACASCVGPIWETFGGGKASRGNELMVHWTVINWMSTKGYTTYPEGLFTEEVGVARIGPQTASDEASPGICRCPCETCT